jgi:Glycosyl transferase family 2
MNEVLRLLDRVLKKQGYSIKKHPQYNLLPLKNFEGLDEQKLVYNSLNSKKDVISANINKVHVCLRTCINDKRAKGKRSELTGVSLEEHLLTCIHSLFVSINEALENNIQVELTVFDDRSESVVIDKLKALATQLNCEWQLVTTEKTGQGASLLEHFSFAKDKDALFYFCEDDYLHEENAIQEMVRFYQQVYKQTGSHLLIHPQEHELIYSQYSYPSYILLGESRRWRSMSNATHTFFIHSHAVKDHWQYFENTKYVGIKEKRHLGSEKKTTDLLFKHIPGFSPIPAVAIHFQTKDCLPPLFDWKKLWQEMQVSKQKLL